MSNWQKLINLDKAAELHQDEPIAHEKWQVQENIFGKHSLEKCGKVKVILLNHLCPVLKCWKGHSYLILKTLQLQPTSQDFISWSEQNRQHEPRFEPVVFSLPWQH